MFYCSKTLGFYIKPYSCFCYFVFYKESRCGFVALRKTRYWFINVTDRWGAYWLPGTIVGAWDAAVNKTAKIPWPHQVDILVRGDRRWTLLLQLVLTAKVRIGQIRIESSSSGVLEIGEGTGGEVILKSHYNYSRAAWWWKQGLPCSCMDFPEWSRGTMWSV